MEIKIFHKLLPLVKNGTFRLHFLTVFNFNIKLIKIRKSDKPKLLSGIAVLY